MFLKEDEFALIKANWLSKDKNVKEIANNLNIGVSSIVFVDDNPVEREIVRSNVAPIEVPDIGNDPSKYQLYLDRNGYFEAVDISNDDMQRNQYYRSNLKRETEEKMYGDYSEYLRSLEMTSQISGFKETDMDRIRQLTNKTNQFNMTTIRMNQTEIDAYRTSGNKLGLSARLEDKFGDNGLVSIIAGSFHDDVFVIDLWLMSCRVFKRDLEYLVFAELVRRLREYGIETVRGIYRPTERNRIIQTLYEELGFQKTYSSEVQVEYEVSLNAIEVKNIDYIKLSGDE
jgi:FkbH-like protein